MALHKRLGLSSFNSSSRLFGSFSLGGWNWNSSTGVVLSNNDGDNTATYYEAFDSNKCHYEVLGVSRLSTPQTLKTAYHKVALKTHPDVSNDPAASNKFKQLQNSYEVLSDVGLRFQYDANKLVNKDSIVEDTPYQPDRIDQLILWAVDKTSFSTNIAENVTRMNHAMFDTNTLRSLAKPALCYSFLGAAYGLSTSVCPVLVFCASFITVSSYASMIAAHEVGHILAFRAYGVPHSSVRFNYLGGFVVGPALKTDWQSAVMYLGGKKLFCLVQ